MISSTYSELLGESDKITHLRAVDAFCKTTPFTRAGWPMVSAETFLQPLSEISLDVDSNHHGAYDGMRGDGEALPRFALRFRQNTSICDSTQTPAPHVDSLAIQLPQTAVTVQSYERTKESTCQNA